MANRREEERERLRQARQERESSQSKSEKRRLFAVYGVAGLIGLLVLAGIIALIASSAGGESGEAHINQASGSTNGVEPDEREGTAPPEAKVTKLKQAASQAGCILRLKLKDEGHTHISPTATTPAYQTNPPTSGSHAEAPYQEADGAYSEMPGEIFIVHSLEHGRMEIQYSPDLPQKTQLVVKGLYDTEYAGALLFPNGKMPYEVAATTWTNLLGCKTYKGAITLDVIRDFGKATWGRYGSESVDAFGPLTGPTPANPSR
jgi:Protein of unknown function (DUF3105)